MIFQSLCRHAGIGANSYLLSTNRARVVLDAGMHPEHEGIEATPHFEFLEEHSIDAAIISHTHLDHVGTLPVLLENQAHARVFMTPETAALSEAMLHNSVNVMQAKRMEHGITEYPLFGHRDLDRLFDKFEHRGCERPFFLDHDDTIRATFHDAGHVLGSVGVSLQAEGKTVLYTGDINFEPSTIQKGALLPTEQVDALIVETTRGAQARDPDYSRTDEENAFAEAIDNVLHRGGSVLIPVFAIGKTQEILAMIHRFKSECRIPAKTPVYIGGLSTKMTHIYDRYTDTSRRKLPGFSFLKDMEIEGTGNRRRRGPVPFHNGCIYALSSGMMTENTVSYNFAKQGLLENKKHGLFFVGYCDPDTPGGRIRATEQGGSVHLDAKGKPIPLRCEKRIFDFSGHAPREHIADYIAKVRPKKAFLVHGDDDATAWFQAEIAKRLPNTQIIIPQPGDKHEI